MCFLWNDRTSAALNAYTMVNKQHQPDVVEPPDADNLPKEKAQPPSASAKQPGCLNRQRRMPCPCSMSAASCSTSSSITKRSHILQEAGERHAHVQCQLLHRGLSLEPQPPANRPLKSCHTNTLRTLTRTSGSWSVARPSPWPAAAPAPASTKAALTSPHDNTPAFC
jgi:hypothetical protein